MYAPNYVKLSRVFAVQLFSVLIGHYAAPPPVRSDPHWSHSHAITASIRLALAPYLRAIKGHLRAYGRSTDKRLRTAPNRVRHRVPHSQLKSRQKVPMTQQIF
jgi:hypothetical protein